MAKKLTGDTIFKILVALIAASAIVILVANSVVLSKRVNHCS